MKRAALPCLAVSVSVAELTPVSSSDPSRVLGIYHLRGNRTPPAGGFALPFRP